MADNDTEYTNTTAHGDKEPATKHDVTEGGAIGAVGGAIVGALAGGPLGAIIGAVAGGAASAAAVDVVDKRDNDYARTAGTGAIGASGTTATATDYDTTTAPTGYGAATTTAPTDYDTTTGYGTGATTNDAGLLAGATGAVGGRGLAGDQVVVPVVEEELQVGKREVQGGGARVSTNVVETPVEQQVTLRDERVTVDRRPVDRPLTDADRPFQEGVIELEETSEVPVVAKSARVVEEVLVGKTASEHTETVRDTVRRTDVQVEQLDGVDTTTRTRSDI